MTLIPWRNKRHEEGITPAISPVSGFRGEMDRLFDSFFRDAVSWGERGWSNFAAATLPLDVEEGDKEIHVRAEIAGVKADDLQLAINGNTLIISGEKKESESHPEGGYVYQERRFGSFRREVTLPCAVDQNDVQAEYRDGVLNVHLKKSQEALPKRIPVSTS